MLISPCSVQVRIADGDSLLAVAEMRRAARSVWCAAVLLLCLGAGAARARGGPRDRVVVTPVALGDSSVNVTEETREGPLAASMTLLNLHSNENGSVVAARAVLYYNGGRLVRLLHNPPGGLATRDVSFSLGGERYTFDPNRMFTPAGAEATLRQLGPYSDAARDAVLAFGRRVLDIYGFDGQRVVVALHNNGPNYSAASYLPGGPFHNDAAAVYVAPGSDAHNFVYTTSAAGFERLSGNDTRIDCVLQANATVTDDGSLSYYAGLHGKVRAPVLPPRPPSLPLTPPPLRRPTTTRKTARLPARTASRSSRRWTCSSGWPSSSSDRPPSVSRSAPGGRRAPPAAETAGAGRGVEREARAPARRAQPARGKR